MLIVDVQLHMEVSNVIHIRTSLKTAGISQSSERPPSAVQARRAVSVSRIGSLVAARADATESWRVGRIPQREVAGLGTKKAGAVLVFQLWFGCKLQMIIIDIQFTMISIDIPK